MNERERLMYLVKNAIAAYKSMDDCDVSEAEFIVDFLIANGVIVPPCKVGDKIYLIVEKRRRITSKCFKFIKISKLTFYNLEMVLKCFGKTIFLTKEEAEAALEGGGEE